MHQLAQINIARAVAPLDDPRLADFVAQLDEINTLAESSPGFVWRLKDDNGLSSSYVKAYDDPNMLVNMSVWASVESLYQFTYKSNHMNVFRERRNWFEAPSKPHLVMWWIPAGHIPTVEEAKERLALLERLGPTAEAFTFKQIFPPPPALHAVAGSPTDSSSSTRDERRLRKNSWMSSNSE
jgi:Domain of unknown function (DUF3291)